MIIAGEAGPSTAEEYEEALDRYTRGKQIDALSLSAAAAIPVYPTKRSGEYRAEVDLTSEGAPTDVTVIFYLACEQGIVQGLRMYDIRVL